MDMLTTVQQTVNVSGCLHQSVMLALSSRTGNKVPAKARMWTNKSSVADLKAVHTSVAAARPVKISVPNGCNNVGGKDPRAAAAPLFTATLGSVSSPRYFWDVRCTASEVSAGLEVAR